MYIYIYEMKHWLAFIDYIAIEKFVLILVDIFKGVFKIQSNIYV